MNINIEMEILLRTQYIKSIAVEYNDKIRKELIFAIGGLSIWIQSFQSNGF